MKTLVDQLAQYGAYHRDTRNLATHLVGVPLIVVAVTTLLARPAVDLGGLSLGPAVVVAILAALFYLALDLRFGIAMGVFLAVSVAIAQWFAAMTTTAWLGAGIGLFVVGWLIQFVGHYYEGRKPAFVDDLVGLLIGPLFIVAEVAFMLGLRREVERQIVERIGPMHGGTPLRT